MNDKLIEKVARAIAANLGHEWSDASQGVKEICEECAQATISVIREALQEPSKEMLRIGFLSADDTADFWKAMLEASPIGGEK